MSPVEPELVELLEDLGRRNEQAAENVLTALRLELAELRGRVDVIERRSGVLVVERKIVHDDGTEEVVDTTAKSAGLGRLGVMLAIIGALTPLTLGVLEVLK